ncbi:MAG: hypothetical protein LDL13_03700 [Calditerrivibrio sp.]|nr:hypothetical protein [Calditerrivibrio sp.]MCA1932662.1 hypothetical protein [Calditerrivibrio sp.]MCA1980264.1 hypothetical protein [Calditerrivibrio sp.]
MKKIFILLSVFLNFSFVYASDEGFSKFLDEVKGGFQEFKNQQDKEFYEYLKNSWEEFKSFSAIKRDEKPKINKAPVVRENVKLKLDKERVKVVNDINYVNENSPEVSEDSQPTKEFLVKDDGLLFYGINLSINPKNYGKLVTLPIKGEKIAEAWKKLATSDTDILIKQIISNGKKQNFSDWAYFKLVKSISNFVYSDSYNDRILFSWFLISKLGYDVKIGYNSARVFLMVPSKQLIYGAQFFNFNGVRYYILFSDVKNIGSLYSYSGKHSDAEKFFVFDIKDNVKSKFSRRDLSFIYDGKRYNFEVEYDIFNVTFYNDFPQTDLSVYYNADVSKHLVNTVVDSMRNLVKGKSEAEAVNIILRFVQTAFKYKTDQEQFGYEKYFLPDETLHYPYSDCEDRSILFSYLVKNILGLKVVLLEYPGHIATAVRFNDDVGGDRLKIENDIYVICDPTYINANIGMAMPQFKGVLPKVIF